MSVIITKGVEEVEVQLLEEDEEYKGDEEAEDIENTGVFTGIMLV